MPAFALLLTLLSCRGGDTEQKTDDSSTPADDTDIADTGLDDGCAPAGGESTLDAWGGDERVALDASGFFRVESLCGRWWFVTPDGHPMQSNGVNSLGPYGDAGAESGVQAYRAAVEAGYDSFEDWAETAAARMKSWNMNTAAGWSSQDLMGGLLPITPVLYLSGSDWLTGDVIDWFDPDFEAAVAERAAEAAAPYADDPFILGWFLDNEIRWGPDWRGTSTLLQLYLAMDAEAPGKAVAVDLLLGTYGSVEAVNAALGVSAADRDGLLATTSGWTALGSSGDDTADQLTVEFVSMAADRYFSVATEAVRAVDPNHLLLGNREVAIMTRPEVFEAATQYLDVISVNNYVFNDGVAELARGVSGGIDTSEGLAGLYALVGKPIVISEYGFRADGEAPPNSWPPQYPTYDDQVGRAAAFAEYARFFQDEPWVAGLHWFRWVDNPPDGSPSDGEDNNWGVVNESDEVYVELTDAMTEVFGEVADRLRVPVQ